MSIAEFAAYPTAWARQLAWLSQAERWHRRGWLSTQQLAGIRAAYAVDCYRPAWPVRVALFIFTLISAGMGGSLAAAMLQPGLVVGALMVFFAAIVALELGIREKRFYHAGPDNALLYLACCAAGFLLGYLYDRIVPVNDFDLRNPRLLVLLLIGLGGLVAAVARYADRGAMGAAFVLYLLLVINLLLPWSVGRALLPFGLMAAAGAAAYLARSPRHATAATYYYENCRQTLRLLALATLYLAGNYLIVREANASLHGQSQSVDPPLSWLFVAFTAGIPLAYIALGLRRADRLLLTLGLLAVGFSVFTLRFYHSLLPPAIAATLAGAALVIGAAAAIRYLRPSRHGLTSVADSGAEAEDDANPFSRANFEALAAAQLSPELPGPEMGGVEFGGGQFGGGGASSHY